MAIDGGWRLLDMNERLRRADAGVSPFYRTHRPGVAASTTSPLGA